MTVGAMVDVDPFPNTVCQLEVVGRLVGIDAEVINPLLFVNCDVVVGIVGNVVSAPFPATYCAEVPGNVNVPADNVSPLLSDNNPVFPLKFPNAVVGFPKVML